MEPTKKKALLVAAAGLSLPLVSAGVALAQDGGGDTASSIIEDTPTAADLDSFAAYWSGGYSFDQLVELSEEWNIGVAEAKARAGALINDGSAATLDALVGSPAAQDDVVETVPAGSTDAFWAAGYTYDDAVELGSEWQLDDPFSAKIQAAELIDAGRADEVEAALDATN